MSTPNCPSPLSADAVLESLERVATGIGNGQSLDCIIALALSEMRRLLNSDRVLLGQRVEKAADSDVSSAYFVPTLSLGQDEPLGADSEGDVTLPMHPQEDELCQDHQNLERVLSPVSIQISHESLEPTIPSWLHQQLVLESEWSQSPHVWHGLIIVVPLWIHQKFWGTLMVQNAPVLSLEPLLTLEAVPHRVIDSRQAGTIELKLIQGMASQLAIAIQQAAMRQDLQGQTQDLDRLNTLKEEFLSTISHELRTPMSSIKMATEMMERILKCIAVQPDIQHQLQNYVQILQDETDREIQLINDLLDLSRLEANAEPILLNTVDFQIWLPYVLSLVQPRISQAGLHLQCVMAENLPLLKTDLSYLEGIVGELLSNAQKYTPPSKGITVKVSTVSPHSPMHSAVLETHSACASPYPLRSLATNPLDPASFSSQSDARRCPDIFNVIADPNQPIFSIAVQNAGAMIPESEYERIFEKFYRIPSSDPWKYPGTGLGLALLKCRVHSIKGVVSVNCDQIGTTFTILLPNLQHPSR